MNPFRLCHHAMCPNGARGLYGKFCARHALDEIIEITEECNGYEKELMATPKAEKETAGKPAFDILFNTPIRDVAAVFTFGSAKYKQPLQWRKSLDGTDAEKWAYAQALMAAAIRHIEEQFGKQYAAPAFDHESNLPSLAHAVADLMMALDILKKASLR